MAMTPLNQTKLYKLARSTPLLDFLVPDLPTQIDVEHDLLNEFPRTPEDGDATRILINYTNARGNSTLHKILDTQRLEQPFDIESFMDGFITKLSEESDDSPNKIVIKSVMTALNISVLNIMGFVKATGSAKELSLKVVPALLAILYDDALDVVIALNESYPQENGDPSDPVIVRMWPARFRST